jgi:hypothetical protein
VNAHNVETMEDLTLNSFSKKSEGLLLHKDIADNPDLSARAVAFQKALKKAEYNIVPKFEDIARAPSWLARDIKDQVRLGYVIGARIHAASLAHSVDAALLRSISEKISESTLDEIIILGETLTESHSSVSLLEIARDGQSVLLATLPKSLQTVLLGSTYFRQADPLQIQIWSETASELLAESDPL